MSHARSLRTACGFAFAMSLLTAAPPASAEVTKEACIAANARGQDLRRAGKLADARADLEACSDPACPGIVRDDCTERRDELERAQPTVIFEVKDGAGHDLIDATVKIDGKPLDRKLDGSALRVDPGGHVFVFTAPGQASVTRTFLIGEGQKERRERIVIGAAPAPAPVPAAPVPATRAETKGSARGLPPQKLAGLIVGGAGVAAVATGAVFGLLTFSAASQQKADCASATSCSNLAGATSDHQRASTDGAVATVAFIAGGALLAGGAALFFTAPKSEASPKLSGFLLAPGLLPGGAGIFARGDL